MVITSHILNDLDEVTNHALYLMQGKVIFFKEIDALRKETSEKQLNKIVVAKINQELKHV